LQRDPELRFSNVSELGQALLPFAPVRARVHAERARGVLFPSAPRQGDEPGAAVEAPSASTLSSWGSEVWAEKRRALVWGFAAAMLVVGLSFTVLALRVSGAATPQTLTTNGIVAASAADALNLSSPVLRPPTAPPAVVVEPVELVKPSVHRETDVKLMPAPKLLAAASAARIAPKLPRVVSPLPAPVAAEEKAPAQVSPFGGRK
jgi:hypothetical protein